MIEQLNEAAGHSLSQITTRLVESLCAFEWRGRCFDAQPQELFRPHGLIIWGAPPQTTVELLKVGNKGQLLVGYGTFPARWFAQGDSFAAISKMVDEGKEPPAWGTWDTAEVGNIIRVSLLSKKGKPLGPDDGIELLMWGKSVRF